MANKKQELLTLREYLGSHPILSLKQFGGGGVPIVHIFFLHVLCGFLFLCFLGFFVFVLFCFVCFVFVLRFISYSQTLPVSLDVHFD